MPKTRALWEINEQIARGVVSTGAATSGGGVATDADTVDGYHAANTPTANYLLTLDGSSQFDPSVIEWADVAGAGLGASGDTLVVQWGTTPTTIQPDDAADGGSAATSARSDHRHAIAAGAPGSISPDDAAAEGTATTFARSDHRHAITTAAPSATSRRARAMPRVGQLVLGPTIRTPSPPTPTPTPTRATCSRAMSTAT